jgi:hypothetical protein
VIGRSGDVIGDRMISRSIGDRPITRCHHPIARSPISPWSPNHARQKIRAWFSGHQRSWTLPMM